MSSSLVQLETIKKSTAREIREKQQILHSQQPPKSVDEFYAKYYGGEHDDDRGEAGRLINKWSELLFTTSLNNTARICLSRIHCDALEADCPDDDILTIDHVNRLNNSLEQGNNFFARTSTQTDQKNDQKTQETLCHSELSTLLSNMKMDFNAIPKVQKISFNTKYFGNNGLFNNYFIPHNATYKWKDTRISNKDKKAQHHFIYTELKLAIDQVSFENPTSKQIKEVQRLFAQKPNFAPRRHDIFSGIYRLFSGKKECTDGFSSLHAVLSQMEKDFYALPSVSRAVKRHNDSIMAKPLPYPRAHSLFEHLKNAREAGRKKDELIIPFRYNRNN
jgi:hypothetical protein